MFWLQIYVIFMQTSNKELDFISLRLKNFNEYTHSMPIFDYLPGVFSEDVCVSKVSKTLIVPKSPTKCAMDFVGLDVFYVKSNIFSL